MAKRAFLLSKIQLSQKYEINLCFTLGNLKKNFVGEANLWKSHPDHLPNMDVFSRNWSRPENWNFEKKMVFQYSPIRVPGPV